MPARTVTARETFWYHDPEAAIDVMVSAGTELPEDHPLVIKRKALFRPNGEWQIVGENGPESVKFTGGTGTVLSAEDISRAIQDRPESPDDVVALATADPDELAAWLKAEDEFKATELEAELAAAEAEAAKPAPEPEVFTKRRPGRPRKQG